MSPANPSINIAPYRGIVAWLTPETRGKRKYYIQATKSVNDLALCGGSFDSFEVVYVNHELPSSLFGGDLFKFEELRVSVQDQTVRYWDPRSNPLLHDSPESAQRRSRYDLRCFYPRHFHRMRPYFLHILMVGSSREDALPVLMW